MDAFEQGPIVMTWDPRLRLVTMRFGEQGASIGGELGAASIARVRAWAGEAPFRLLVDCEHIADADAGWRKTWGDFVRERGYRDVIAWYRPTLLIRIIVTMFLRATRARLRGAVFDTEEEARAWLLAAEVRA